MFLVLTVGIGLVWFLGAVVFPAQNWAMLRTPQIDQAAQMGVAELSFWTPEKVLRGDQPQDLVLIYAPEGPGGPNSPFTLTLSTTSPYLFFIDPRNKQATTQLTLPLTATNTIGLVHTRTLPWWQAGSALVDVRLTGAPPPDGNPQEGAFPVELALEPGWQEALRGLSTQMAPIFLLALAGAVSSFFGLQLNQAEKRRKKAEKALGDFYQHLVKRDFPASQGAYQDMQKSKESLPAVDLERVEALFGLAEGDLGSENYTAIQA
ncbi:MAG: hypothetical protein MUO62_17305, partial [Anaerolineales bacterium]|nr:hypothetical protein [Anaerolineales bacterium]